MPEEAKTVDIDTSGPGAEINLQEDKKENEIEVSNETVENNTESNDSSEESNEQLDVQSNEQETEKKEEVKKEDDKLEEYSKGVQARIAKLTRKMREAERREAAAVEYANALEQKRRLDQERFNKVDSEYNAKFAESVKSEMESVQKQLATAIESGDAAAQVQANKRIAELAFEDAKLKRSDGYD